jgi:hypothetical protein
VIQRHVLRVSRRRCSRIVEIQKADAIRLYGQQAVWKDVGHRILNDTCQRRRLLEGRPAPVFFVPAGALAEEGSSEARAMTAILAARCAEARAQARP